MDRKTVAAALLALSIAGCASPQDAGQAVGQSLYNASVSTGRALSTAGDRTGQAFQNAGTSLRNTFNPPPPYGAPPAYPSPGYAPAGPVEQQSLPPVDGGYRVNPSGYPASTGEPGDDSRVPPNPAMGY